MKPIDKETIQTRRERLLNDLRMAKEAKDQLLTQLESVKRQIEHMTGALMLCDEILQDERPEAPPVIAQAELVPKI
jgi:hypothetical protein